ncbi:MAG: radical SAM protein [Candidatus Nanoarchaeia archaeon]|nr:radical SAM protein [Candidatus Nanoarchaeia archaeon]
MAFDAVKLSAKIEKEFCVDNKRKYYRFRFAKQYGGIATADVAGCNLRCSYCWSQNKAWYPETNGDYFSPKEVAGKLTKLMVENKTGKCRISGGEPTICRNHLIEVIKNLPSECLFVLETNGILLGYDPSYIKELSKFSNLHIRLSIKASDFDMFEQITGAKKEFLSNQISAVKSIDEAGISYNLAVMHDLYSEKKYYDFLEKLEKIIPSVHSKIENEQLILFNFLKSRVEKRSLIEYLKESGRIQ